MLKKSMAIFLLIGIVISFSACEKEKSSYSSLSDISVDMLESQASLSSESVDLTENEEQNSLNIIEDFKTKWDKAYRKALTGHPASYNNCDTLYTYYDVNKDDTPEIIIKLGGTYYFYTFYENRVVNCGEVTTIGDQEFYEYEGEGIIFAGYGGGSLYVKFIQLYTLENFEIVYDKTILDTATGPTTEDYQNELKKYKLITNYYLLKDADITPETTHSASDNTNNSTDYSIFDLMGKTYTDITNKYGKEVDNAPYNGGIYYIFEKLNAGLIFNNTKYINNTEYIQPTSDVEYVITQSKYIFGNSSKAITVEELKAEFNCDINITPDELNGVGYYISFKYQNFSVSIISQSDTSVAPDDVVRIYY